MMENSQPQLIEEVRKRPGLWSPDCPTDRDEKLALWKEVGAAMFKDWHECSKATAYDRVLQIQRKWRSLRDAYKRELRSRTRSVRINKTTYRYFKIMSFLGGFDKSTTGMDGNEEERIVPENNDSVVYHEDIENSENMEIETLEAVENLESYHTDNTDPDPLVHLTVVSSSNPTTIAKKTKRPRAKKRKVEPPSSEDMDELADEMEIPVVYGLDANERERDQEHETDTDKLFLMSFLPEMKQLPLNIKMWVRAQIANTMQEAVTCHYNNTSPPRTKTRRQESSE